MTLLLVFCHLFIRCPQSSLECILGWWRTWRSDIKLLCGPWMENIAPQFWSVRRKWRKMLHLYIQYYILCATEYEIVAFPCYTSYFILYIYCFLSFVILSNHVNGWRKKIFPWVNKQKEVVQMQKKFYCMPFRCLTLFYWVTLKKSLLFFFSLLGIKIGDFRWGLFFKKAIWEKRLFPFRCLR